MAAKLFALSLSLVVALATLTFGEEQTEDVDINKQIEEALQMVSDGETAKGIKTLNALAKAYSYAPAYFFAGQCFEDLGDYDFAIGAYSRAITTPGSNVVVPAHLKRGRLFLKQVMCREALDDFKNVLELDPVNAEAHYGHGRALVELANQEANSDRIRKVETAIESFDRAIRFDDNLALAYYERGMAKAILGQTLEAAEDLRRASSLAKKDDAFLRRLVDLTVKLQTDNESLRAEITTLKDEAAHQAQDKNDAVLGINEMAATLREIRDLLQVHTARR